MRPEQARAADLLGRGWLQRDVAAEVGVTDRTLRHWRKTVEGFAAAIERARKAADLQNPTPRTVLEAALGATRTNGQPDWPTRVAAARELRRAAPTPDEPPTPTETTIHADRLEDGS